jgi:acetyl coenzyme A synthetase (ADP forming)-like protein
MDPLDNFFSPQSVAVVGASSKPGKIGHELVRNISQYQFKGKVYPINPNAEAILGLKCYPSINAVQEKIDLAVYVAASNILPDLVEEAGRKGVKNAIIVSGGFKEMGEDKALYEDQLVATTHKYGMRIIGPNCIGVFDSTSRLDTFFYPHDRMIRPTPGGVSFVTQSGTFGLTFLEWATNSRLGMRRLVSLGNRCDVNEIDMVRYLGRDPLTKVIALHLESISDGRQLFKEAREVTTRKPIVALKTGRVEGSKAAKSHTGAITGSYQVCKSLLKSSGMILAESFEELFDLSKAIEKQPVARGRNLTIVTNAAGPSVAAADLCHESGLKIVDFSKGILNKLVSSLPSYAVIGEYVDLTGSATTEDYQKTFQIVLEEDSIDAIVNFVVFLNPPLSSGVVNIIAEVQRQGKPIVCWATGGDFSQQLINKLEEAGVPTYPTTERVIRAIQGLIEAGKTRKWHAPDTVPARRDLANEIFTNALSDDHDMLTEVESKDILRDYGIKTTTEYVAKTASEASSLATKLGFPVVMKVLSVDITHKSDVGGVMTNVRNSEEAFDTFNQIIQNVKGKKPEATIDGVLIENQLAPGVEVIVGSTVDRDFGTVVAFGLGGLFVEAFQDLTYGLAPLSEEEALSMISNTKAAKLLAGIRGQPPADLKSLANLIMRASFLAFEQPIAEMDLNPVIVSADECTVADARIRIKN